MSSSVHRILMQRWRKQVNEKSLICYLCGQLILKQEELSADHVVPKSKGGTTSFSNLKPTHKICNNKKGDKTFFQYLKQQAEHTR